MKELKRKEYEQLLKPLQLELAAMARWAAHAGARIVVLMEGRDTAGKGGAINAIREHLNPRQCHVAALPKPGERESTSGTCNVTSHTCRRRVKSCCSIAAGTTAPGWKR